VRGMNRLRGAYLEIDPGIADYFITGSSEDAEAIFRTFGSMPGEATSLDTGLFHGFVTTPITIAFVDAMLAAVLTAIVVVELSSTMLPAAGIGVLTFLVVGAALAYFGYRSQAMAHLYADSPASQDETAPKNQ
jgi:hypothetical protein